MNYDVIIVGAGPGGIFTALELIRRNKDKKILLIEEGRSIDKRSCPKIKTNKCVSCKTILSYNYWFFWSWSVFRWKTFIKL